MTSCSIFSEEIRWLVEARLAKNMRCREKVLPSRAARDYMSWRDERKVTPSTTARGDRMSGAKGCWGTL